MLVRPIKNSCTGSRREEGRRTTDAFGRLRSGRDECEGAIDVPIFGGPSWLLLLFGDEAADLPLGSGALGIWLWL